MYDGPNTQQLGSGRLRRQGQRLRLQGRIAEAELEFRRALILDPRSAQILLCLAECLATQGRWNEALVQARSAVALNPDNAGSCIILGYALAQSGEADEAERVYRHALALEPKRLQTSFLLGQVLLDKGKFLAAEKMFKAVCQIQPNNPESIAGVRESLYGQEKWIEALDAAECFIVLRPDDYEGHERKAKILEHLSKYEEAEQSQRNALKNSPNNPKLCHFLAYILLRKGDIIEAEKHSVAAVSAQNLHEYKLLLGEILAQQGRWDDASKQFAEAAVMVRESLRMA